MRDLVGERGEHGSQVDGGTSGEGVQGAVEEMGVVEYAGHRNAVTRADVEGPIGAVQCRRPRFLIAHEQFGLAGGAGGDTDQQFGIRRRGSGRSRVLQIRRGDHVVAAETVQPPVLGGRGDHRARCRDGENARELFRQQMTVQQHHAHPGTHRRGDHNQRFDIRGRQHRDAAHAVQTRRAARDTRPEVSVVDAVGGRDDGERVGVAGDLRGDAVGQQISHRRLLSRRARRPWRRRSAARGPVPG